MCKHTIKKYSNWGLNPLTLGTPVKSKTKMEKNKSQRLHTENHAKLSNIESNQRVGKGGQLFPQRKQLSTRNVFHHYSTRHAILRSLDPTYCSVCVTFTSNLTPTKYTTSFLFSLKLIIYHTRHRLMLNKSRLYASKSTFSHCAANENDKTAFFFAHFLIVFIQMLRKLLHCFQTFMCPTQNARLRKV